MGAIAENLARIRDMVPAGVELVAVSKFKPIADVIEAYEAGQRDFGESRVQEILEKIPLLPADTRWHFIGHLQTNKVRSLIGKTYLIESVDSERLLELIDSESVKAGETTRVLLQVHVAREETKFGFSPDELLEYFKARKFEGLAATHIAGLMCMASNTDDTGQIRSEFALVADLMRKIRESLPQLRGFDCLSMGMSSDWPIAVEEGATSVRIGTAIFGNR